MRKKAPYPLQKPRPINENSLPSPNRENGFCVFHENWGCQVFVTYLKQATGTYLKDYNLTVTKYNRTVSIWAQDTGPTVFNQGGKVS